MQLEDTIEIDSFAIEPTRKNSGYGRLLLEFA